jgi:hypothetical protein
MYRVEIDAMFRNIMAKTCEILRCVNFRETKKILLH